MNRSARSRRRELYAIDSAYRLRHRHRTEAERESPDSRLKFDWYEQHRRYGRIWTPIVGAARRPAGAGRLDPRDPGRGGGASARRLARFPSSRTAPTPGDIDIVEEAGIVGGVRVDAEWWQHCNERCAQMTWRVAQHSRELLTFVERDGGLFLMADAESEVRAVDALYRVGIYLPFGDANVSWMRRLLTDEPHHELDVFMERLLAEERWPR